MRVCLCRLTVSETGSGEAVWVNRNKLPLRREVEARPHNILTITDRDIAFQVVPLHSGDNLLWDLEVAQRLRLQLHDAQGSPRFDKRLHRRDANHFAQVSSAAINPCAHPGPMMTACLQASLPSISHLSSCLHADELAHCWQSEIMQLWLP